MSVEHAKDIRNREGHVVAPAFVAGLILKLRSLSSTDPIACIKRTLSHQ